MVHKKYTYKKGKKFGPYYYETKRVNGKVITTYIGKADEGHKINNKIIYPVLFILLLGAILLFFVLSDSTFNIKDGISGFVSETYSFLTGLSVGEEGENAAVVEGNSNEGENAGSDKVIEDDGEESTDADSEDNGNSADIISEQTDDENSENSSEESNNEGEIVNEGNEDENEIEEINESETNEEEVNETLQDENKTSDKKEIIGNGNKKETLNINETILVNLTQFNAVLGQPVKWIKKIDVNGLANLTIELPASAENISIRKIARENATETKVDNETLEDEKELEENNTIDERFDDGNMTIENNEDIIEEANEDNVIIDGGEGNEIDGEEDVIEDTGEKIINQDSGEETVNEEITEIKVSITGEVSFVDSQKGFNIFNWFRSILRFTGLIVDDETIDTREIIVEISEKEESVEIEYYTDAPYSIEKEKENGKEVRVISPEDVHYENVLVYTNLSESFNIRGENKIRIKWLENNTLLDTYSINDSDGNGIYDYVEWIAPELSNQTFNVILITRAEHLDENRSFINDIYESVRELDGNWSEEIYDGHYVRVEFEENLTSQKDITIYPRAANGTNISDVLIDIYENNGNETIAQFSNIIENSYNKVYLTDLNGTQDVFDLHILNGSLEFDHIIDPESGAVPNITFQGDTPTNASSQSYSSIVVNLSTADENGEHYAFTDFNKDLMLWMRMDDLNSSLDPIDLSTFGNNGTFVGNAKINSTGKVGNGSWHDGAGDYIKITANNHNFNWTDGTNFTVSAWIYLRSIGPSIQTAFSNGGRTAQGTTLLIVQTDNSAFFTTRNNTASLADNLEAPSSLTLNAWNYVTLVRTGKNKTIYVSGTARASNLEGGGDLGLVYDLRAGTEATGVWPLNGSVDELIIFNRSLSSQEIKALYNATANKYYNNFTDLVSGDHIFRGYTVDLAGNKNQTEHRTVTVDATVPTVLLLSPPNDTKTTNAQQWFNSHFTDNLNVSNATLYIYNSTNNLVGANFTGLGNSSISANISFTLNYTGTFYWNFLAIDSLNNRAFNRTNYTLTMDNVVPNVTINLPTNTTYTSVPVNFNISLSENGSVIYSLDKGINNITMNSSDEKGKFGRFFNASNSSIANAAYSFNVYANDTIGNNNYTHFTSFIISVSADSPPAQGGSSGGGGGGASSTTSKVSIEIIPEEINIETIAGKETIYEIIITNKGDSNIKLGLSIEGLEEFIKVQEPLSLNKSESKAITLNIGKIEKGILVGSLVVRSGNSIIKKHPIVLNVKSDNFLFDSSITIPAEFKTIQKGDKLHAQVNLLQVGDKEEVDVKANYIIKDFSGNIYLEESETFSVLDSKEFIKEFSINELAAGKYVLGLEIIYPGAFATSSSQFTVIEGRGVFSAKEEMVWLVIFSAVILLAAGICLILRRKKKLNEARNA